jgi:hypothetical protein
MSWLPQPPTCFFPICGEVDYLLTVQSTKYNVPSTYISNICVQIVLRTCLSAAGVHASATKNEFKFRFETRYQTTPLSTVGR